MPNIFAMIKNYSIESEDDIPEQLREEIERRLSSVEQIFVESSVYDLCGFAYFLVEQLSVKF